MKIEKYEYKYNDNGGYHLEPENIEILQMLPKNEKENGLVKVCLKNKNLYLFFAKDVYYKDISNRGVETNYDIYVISNFKKDDLNEIVKKFEITTYLSNESKKNLIKTISKWNSLDKKRISFDEDYFPFAMLRFLNKNENVCFEKEKFFGNVKLNNFEKRFFNNLNENLLKEYFEYLTKKRLGKEIKKYLNQQEIEEVLEILEPCKKEIYLKAEKWEFLDTIIPQLYELNCNELKKTLLLKYIDIIADEKEIASLFKQLSSRRYKFIKKFKNILE
jgi:hypothetical protein